MDVVLNGDRRGMQGPLQSVCSPPVSSNLMCLAHGSIPLDCKHKGPSSLLDVLNSLLAVDFRAMLVKYPGTVLVLWSGCT